jgi:hypothetical protein
MAVTVHLYGEEGQIPADISAGDVLITACECYCERSLNRFELDKKVLESVEVTVQEVIYNHFGTFVVGNIGSEMYFFKPSNLKLKN